MYFIVPGIYKVSYTPFQIGKAISATFSVTGPKITANDVKTRSGRMQIGIGSGDYEWQLKCGATGFNAKHCASFYVDKVAGKLGGIFKWTQLVTTDTEQWNTNGQTPGNCSTPEGLDNYYPWPTGKINCNDSLTCQADSPAASFSNYTYFERNFEAQMYLMWNPELADSNGKLTSIDVPVGVIPWGFNVSVQYENNAWANPNPITPNVGAFQPQSVFPTWTINLENVQCK